MDRFNARDFDAVCDMLAEEVRLELVSRTRIIGRAEVGRYFSKYASVHDGQLAAGLVDGCPALIVRDPPTAAGRPAYFSLLQWVDERVSAICDFRCAGYAIEAAEAFVV